MNWKLNLFFIGIAAALISGCERYIDSNDPVRPFPAEGPVPINVTAQLVDGAVVLGWAVEDPSGVARYRVYSAPASDTSHYTLRDSTTGTSIILSELAANIRYYFTVAAVSATGFEWKRCEPVSARVLYLSISINGGNEYTSSTAVQVRVNIPQGLATHTILSESPILAGAQYLPISGTQTPFTLSQGDGLKIVYAKVQFDDGTTTAEVLADSITLDTHAAIDSVFFSSPGSDGYFTVGESIKLGVDAVERGGTASVSFTGAGAVQLYDDGTNGDNLSGDGIYYGQWVVPINFTLNNGAVSGNFTDAAGNRPPPQTASRSLNIFTPPPALTASALAKSGSEIELTWTSSVSTDFAFYRIYRSTTATVNMQSTLVTTLEGQAATGYTDDGLSGNTTYYYRVYVYNHSGLSTGSTVVSAMTPPAAGM